MTLTWIDIKYEDSDLKVVDASKVFQPSPHDPHLVGNHFAVLVEDVDNHGLVVKPEWILKWASTQRLVEKHHKKKC